MNEGGGVRGGGGRGEKKARRGEREKKTHGASERAREGGDSPPPPVCFPTPPPPGAAPVTCPTAVRALSGDRSRSWAGCGGQSGGRPAAWGGGAREHTHTALSPLAAAGPAKKRLPFHPSPRHARRLHGRQGGQAGPTPPAPGGRPPGPGLGVGAAGGRGRGRPGRGGPGAGLHRGGAAKKNGSPGVPTALFFCFAARVLPPPGRAHPPDHALSHHADSPGRPFGPIVRPFHGPGWGPGGRGVRGEHKLIRLSSSRCHALLSLLSPAHGRSGWKRESREDGTGVWWATGSGAGVGLGGGSVRARLAGGVGRGRVGRGKKRVKGERANASASAGGERGRARGREKQTPSLFCVCARAAPPCVCAEPHPRPPHPPPPPLSTSPWQNPISLPWRTRTAFA